MSKPSLNVDPNRVIDFMAAENAKLTRQYAEVSAAFNTLMEDNERLRKELGQQEIPGITESS